MKLMYTPVNPNFTIQMGCKGFTIHGYVSMMLYLYVHMRMRSTQSGLLHKVSYNKKNDLF